MKRILKIIAIIIGSAMTLLIVGFIVIYIQWLNLKTDPFTDNNGKTIGNSVAILQHIKIGGIKQSVLIRGINKDNPVLLFLHGGPGFPEMAFVRKNNSYLENYFIVVNWDQRGAGKSYSPFIPKNTMNLNQFVADAHELTGYLKQKFNKNKIYVVGHSWGSYLGINLVKKYPEDYYAYVGIGQVVNMIDNEKLSFKYTLDMALKTNDAKAVRDLKVMEKTYPEINKTGIKKMMMQRQYLVKYGGEMFNETGNEKLYKDADIKEYNIYDLLLIFVGGYFSINNLWNDLLINSDLIRDAKVLEVPVYFFIGRHDYNTPFELAEKYYNILEAPKKELIWFEKSAHMVINEEPNKFNDIMVNKVLKETYIK